MNAARKGPRTDSQGYRALEKLHKLGGQADSAALMCAAGWTGSVSLFDLEIVGSLLRYQVVTKRGTQLVLATSGYAFLGVAPVAPVAGEQTPDTPMGRYVPPMRGLSSKYMPRLAVIRPGALDYRAIPSLFGDQRIPHGAKAAA